MNKRQFARERAKRLRQALAAAAELRRGIVEAGAKFPTKLEPRWVCWCGRAWAFDTWEEANAQAERFNVDAIPPATVSGPHYVRVLA